MPTTAHLSLARVWATAHTFLNVNQTHQVKSTTEQDRQLEDLRVKLDWTESGRARALRSLDLVESRLKSQMTAREALEQELSNLQVCVRV